MWLVIGESCDWDSDAYWIVGYYSTEQAAKDAAHSLEVCLAELTRISKSRSDAMKATNAARWMNRLGVDKDIVFPDAVDYSVVEVKRGLLAHQIRQRVAGKAPQVLT